MQSIKYFPDTPYKKGDFIGQKYEVFQLVGEGGFGVVYLVYSHETRSPYALKTFKNKYLQDIEKRGRFYKEAQIWVNLERHPYLVRAYCIEEIAGRLFICMEFIAPDENDLNSLDGYLEKNPPNLVQSLHWGIQFCHGMEYAYSRGIRCHRDIKPDNIMISQDKTVKISDFGLAGILGFTRSISGIEANNAGKRVGLSSQTPEGVGMGLPPYMSPEQFFNSASCNEKSDIYSFGIVLYQMASGGELPFLAKTLNYYDFYRLHCKSPVPRLKSPLSPFIQRCLAKDPNNRYQTFKELRRDLEWMLKHETGEIIKPPELKELQVWELNNKGNSLGSLGHNDEAIGYFDKALELDPQNALVWNNKGTTLSHLGHYEEAKHCFDKALELNSKYSEAWANKGGSLNRLGRYSESINCCDKAIELNPKNAGFWNNKGESLNNLGHYDEAIRCFNKAIELDIKRASAWYNKGNSLSHLGEYVKAIHCYDNALKINPFYIDAWNNKGNSLDNLGCYDEAILCYNKILELDPQNADTLNNKGNSLCNQGRYLEAIHCYEKALELNPQDPEIWNNKGTCFGSLGYLNDALHCHNRALEIDPCNIDILNNKALTLASQGLFNEATACLDKALNIDQQCAYAYFGKGLIEDKLGRRDDAVYFYQKFIALAEGKYSAQIKFVHQRLREFRGR